MTFQTGKHFKDERPGLLKKHDRPGLLSMGNSGKNSNTSQFFITFNSTPQCDNKHVIFGEVVSGFEVLEYIHESTGTGDGTPSKPVKISNCGMLDQNQPWCGYWLNLPDDSFAGFTPVFYGWPRILIVASSDSVYERFKNQADSKCYNVMKSYILDSDSDSNDSKINELGNSFDLTIVAFAIKDKVTLEKLKNGKIAKPNEIGTILDETFQNWNFDTRK